MERSEMAENIREDELVEELIDIYEEGYQDGRLYSYRCYYCQIENPAEHSYYNNGYNDGIESTLEN